MQAILYFITFLEGIITFVSPCLLPMLPIYISYFAGSSNKKPIKNAVGFVLGFTIVFILLGCMAGVFGQLLVRYKTIINIVTGLIVVIFGLNYVGVFNFSLLSKSAKNSPAIKITGFKSAVLFGIVFSIGWTPCVGTFLGSALMLASNQNSILQGAILLLFYSLGLALPFLICAVLIDSLKSSIAFIKRNYAIINKISGFLLVILGILMISGLLSKLLNILSI